ncbi:solute symporter family protein [Actinomadura rudentiformis]|uniref:Cation acetate symporter n=1 Tax=Actinomadura rudentiformis TaxID=359158 RepID=A0A6H9Y7E9_9ACTN|nr:cation acetate symporter [Actinomadura rudentiformis]KAB2339806.1 cation acetate symporter [Actinomadura rudentiformis]
MSHETLSVILFLTFVAGTLAITLWAGRHTKDATDFYAGGRSFSGGQNGLAIGGDYMSAASFLGIAGLIALYGYDGFLYSIGFLVAWLVALLLVAELMRNSGKFTMADVLAFRMSPRPVRTAAGVSTITVSIFYLLAQMVGAGALVALLFGFKSEFAKGATIVLVGILMIVYVVVGGMKGTTWVQIVKAILLMGGATLTAVLVLGKFGFNLSTLLRDAATQSGKSGDFLEPGLRYATEAQGLTGKLDLISLGLALVLGTAGLPHILIRFYTVPTARDARKSVLWGIAIIGSFYLLTLVLGFGAAALVGTKEIAAANPAGNTAAPQLAERIGEIVFGDVGGTVLLAIIAAVAFATILAVVAGLTLASSSSFAHDLYAHVFKKGNVTDREEVRVARISAFVIGAVAIVLGIYAQKLNVAFLVALAFAVAASGNLPAILYSLFWKRFNTAGAVSAIYGGLGSAVVLVIFSPVVSGTPKALFTDSDFSFFPLENPGIISIPFGFFCGWLGTILSKEYNAQKYAEIEVRSLTGAGAEKAVHH